MMAASAVVAVRTSEPDQPYVVGNYTMFRPTLDRQPAMDAFAAIRSGHPMVGLIDLDVTDALTAIATARQRATSSARSHRFGVHAHAKPRFRRKAISLFVTRMVEGPNAMTAFSTDVNRWREAGRPRNNAPTVAGIVTTSASSP